MLMNVCVYATAYRDNHYSLVRPVTTTYNPLLHTYNDLMNEYVQNQIRRMLKQPGLNSLVLLVRSDEGLLTIFERLRDFNDSLLKDI